MIDRPYYVQKLIGFKDKHLIKIVTGVRRCGKSTLFRLFQEYLLNNGVTDHNPKYLITADYFPASSYNGIQHVNAFDWLLS